MKLRPALLVLALAAALPAAAHAQSPNVAFAGRIMCSDQRFPGSANNPGAYTAAIRRQAKSNFYERKGSWRIYTAAFLSQPLDDVEYVVKVYELRGRQQQLLTSFDQYADQRGERTVLSNMDLRQNQVGANKQVLLTLESKGKVLASTQVKLLSANGQHYTGKVDFSGGDGGKKRDDG